MLDYDIVIIGAGPAGLMAAETILTNSKKHVLVLDKQPAGYKKPCGGGLPIDCLTDFPFLKEYVTHSTNLVMAKYKATDRIYNNTIHMAPRDKMRLGMINRLTQMPDSLLHFGILYSSRVEEINLESHILKLANGVEIHYKDWLVGADGATSIVAKKIGFKYHNVPIVVLHAEPADPGFRSGMDNIALIEFIDNLPGYFWIFPKGKYLNIGMGGDIKGKLLHDWFKDKFDSVVMDLLDNSNIYLRTIYQSAHLIPGDVNLTKPPFDFEHRVILCGDAASFVNPITGEGIWFALTSGKEAAEVILGTRAFSHYPSFKPYLSRVQAVKNDIRNLPIKESFEQIFGDHKDGTSGDMVKFLFSHAIPQPRILSEDEKTSIYGKILED